MVRRKILIVLILALAGCRADSPAAPEPQKVPATKGQIITIQSTLPQPNRVLQHEIVAANGLVRSGDEVDRWRLLDLEQSRVIFVDDVAKTQREMTLAELRERKQRLAQGPVPDWYPEAVFRKTGQSRRILGREADEYILQAGGFRRELWISREPILSPDYMALRFGSDEPGGPAPAALARLHLQLMQLEGFPLIDRITMPVGDATWGVLREVRSIEEGPIARERFEIPRDYGTNEEPNPLAAPSYPVPSSPR